LSISLPDVLLRHAIPTINLAWQPAVLKARPYWIGRLQPYLTNSLDGLMQCPSVSAAADASAPNGWGLSSRSWTIVGKTYNGQEAFLTNQTYGQTYPAYR